MKDFQAKDILHITIYGRGEENDRKFLPISVFMHFLKWMMVEINLLQQLDSTGIPSKM